MQYAESSQNAPVATIIRVFQAQIDEESKGPSSQVNNSLNFNQDKNKTTAAFEKVLQLSHREPFKRKT